uniref:WAP domain-containing protein n=1 Tax=Steinernema glaseri TaxID=37863 RepID=A0A1I7ZJS1_9BILA
MKAALILPVALALLALAEYSFESGTDLAIFNGTAVDTLNGGANSTELTRVKRQGGCGCGCGCCCCRPRCCCCCCRVVCCRVCCCRPCCCRPCCGCGGGCGGGCGCGCGGGRKRRSLADLSHKLMNKIAALVSSTPVEAPSTTEAPVFDGDSTEAPVKHVTVAQIDAFGRRLF